MGKHLRAQVLSPRQRGRYGRCGPRHERSVNELHGESGFYISPAVLAGVAQDSRYVQEKIFGPVLTVQPFDTVSMPFGGYDQSGYGRENGPEGLDEYLQTKSVVISL